MKRLTKRSKNTGMTWYKDAENNNVLLEPCEMSSHHNRLVLEKLASYEDAEENGKNLKIPCDVGDTIWDIAYGKPCSYKIVSVSLDRSEKTAKHPISSCLLWCYCNKDKSVTSWFTVDDIGIKVFLTEEAAKQRLEREKEWRRKH